MRERRRRRREDFLTQVTAEAAGGDDRSIGQEIEQRRLWVKKMEKKKKGMERQKCHERGRRLDGDAMRWGRDVYGAECIPWCAG